AVPDPAADDELDPFRAVDRRHDVGMLVQPMDVRGRLRARDQDEVNLEGIDEGLVHEVSQLREPASGPHGDCERGPVEFGIREDVRASRHLLRCEFISLREHRDDGVRGDVREEGARCESDLPSDLEFGVGRVDQEEDEVRLEDFLEGRMERLDQPERHAVDEPDRVREENAPPRSSEAPRRRGQGREHPVLHEQVFVRQSIAQGGLPRVRIAGEGHQMIAPVLPHDSTNLPFSADRLELVSDFLHPSLHGFVVRGDPLADLVELAATDERARIRVVPTLDDRLDDAVARGPHEGRDLRDVGVQGDQEDVQAPVPRRRPRHKAFQWKGWGGGHRTRLETQGELTLNKGDYTLREPTGTPSLREVEDGTSRDPPAAMPQRRMDQTDTCSITPRSRGQVCVAINPSPTREITPRAADTYRRDGRRIRNAKIAERPPPP